MLLALASMWKGDITLYRKAKVHICEAPWKDIEDKQIMSLSLACIDSAVRDISMDGYPEWFRKGQFEHLPLDSHPAAKIFYIKYFLIAGQEQAKGAISLPDVSGMGLMRIIPYIAEPMIADAFSAKLVVPEIYLRLLAAIAYHQLGDDESAIPHIDRAIDLALPDGLFGILAEHRRNLDNLLDDRLIIKDKDACEKCRALHKELLEGWTKTHNSLLSKNVSRALTIREREVGRLAAFGLSNEKIAERLCLSVDSVKKTIFRAMNKTGAANREEIGAYV
jgi:DNA-binding NarL/FixJ family response regulator